MVQGTHISLAAITPESSGPCKGHVGVGTRRGGYEVHEIQPPKGGYTRVLSVIRGSCGQR